MSLLVRYTLKSQADHASQIKAMQTLVSDLGSEGIAGLDYSCFETDDPIEFIGVLQFDSNAIKEKFLKSAAFESYRETVGPTFANPPKTTKITAVATTRQAWPVQSKSKISSRKLLRRLDLEYLAP